MRRFVKEVHQGVKTFLAGMRVTGGYLRANFRPKPRKVVTATYDGTVAEAKKVVVAERFRGNLVCDSQKCGVCKQCVRVCPVDCIFVEGERTETGKMRPSRFEVDLGRCIYCGLCVRACPSKCLTLSPEWWGATKAGTATGAALRDPHGLVREHGLGFYTPEQKAAVEGKRRVLEEARKKAAAEAAAKKAVATAAAAKPADPPAPASPTPPAPAGPAM